MEGTVQLPAILSRYRPELEAELRSILTAADPELLYRMMHYHMGWIDVEGRPGVSLGKALRPTMCFMACEAVGGDWRQALPAAAALEIVHNFSLIHDDIQDGDRERHHRPTVWAIWGQPQAINAGDAMLAIGHLTLLRLREHGVEDGRVLLACQALGQSILEMVQGQCMDLSFEDSLEISVEAYREMISKKTGALYECSLHLGALIGTSRQEAVEGLRRFGRLLGLTFQVRDDVLGIWGDVAVTGKPSGNDIKRKKKSLPVVYTLAKAQGSQRQELLRIYGQEVVSDEDAQQVLSIMHDLGAYDFCRGIAEEHGVQALAALEGLDLVPAIHEAFREVAAFFLGRQF